VTSCCEKLWPKETTMFKTAQQGWAKQDLAWSVYSRTTLRPAALPPTSKDKHRRYCGLHTWAHQGSHSGWGGGFVKSSCPFWGLEREMATCCPFLEQIPSGKDPGALDHTFPGWCHKPRGQECNMTCDGQSHRHSHLESWNTEYMARVIKE
jgi:hypothetical protein